MYIRILDSKFDRSGEQVDQLIDFKNDFRWNKNKKYAGITQYHLKAVNDIKRFFA